MGRKCLVYLRGGCGDIYPFLVMVPEILRENNLNIDDIQIYIDSVYLQDPEKHQFDSQTMFKLFAAYGFTRLCVLDKCHSTAWDLLWSSKEAIVQGPKININFREDDFMFWRSEFTKRYMKSQLEKHPDAIFIDGVVDRIFQWENGKYKQLTYDEYPVKFIMKDSEKIFIDTMLKEKHILIHYRIKGTYDNNNYFNSVIDFCNKQNRIPIFIGLKGGNLKGNFIDLRERLSVEELFYIVEKADLMLTSSSIISYHRVYFNYEDRKTILCTPYHLGGFICNFNQKIYNNQNHIFLNSDEDNLEKIYEVIKGDKYER